MSYACLRPRSDYILLDLWKFYWLAKIRTPSLICPSPSPVTQRRHCVTAEWVQGALSRKSRELFGPEKPFEKLRPTYSVKLVFSYVVKEIKIKRTAKFRASRRLCFEDTKRLCHPKYALNVSGLSRNRPQNWTRSAESKETAGIWRPLQA